MMKCRFSKTLKRLTILSTTLVLASFSYHTNAHAANSYNKDLGASKKYFMHVYLEKDNKVCNTYSLPLRRTSLKKRKGPSLNITNRKAYSTKHNIAIDFGIRIGNGKKATVRIGENVFVLFTHGNYAFPYDGDEAFLFAAMVDGQKLVVKVRTRAGKQIIDTYSLSGLRRAVEIIDNECNKK